MTKQEISKLLYRHDPMGLAKIGAPSDEYDSEAEDIATQLKLLAFENEIQELVHRVFVKWFNNNDPKISLAGSAERYTEIAKEIHQSLQMDINLMFYIRSCRYLSGNFSGQPLFDILVAYGTKVIPKLLAEMGEHGFMIFSVLHAIVGDSGPAVREEDRGKFEPIRDMWLSWGKEHGYV